MSVIGPLVTAAKDALNVPAVTSLATGGVFDDVPSRQVFPYVRVGSPTSNRVNTFAAALQDSTVQVHVFSRYEGVGQAGAILTACEDILDGAALVIAGHSTINVECEQDFEAGLEDVVGVGKVRHYVQIYRVWTGR